MSLFVAPRSTLSLAVLAMAMTLPRAVWAQAPSPPVAPASAPPAPAAPDGTRAVALAQEGRAAYEANRFDEAYERFAAAQSLAASPAFELYMARSRRGAGRLLEARTIYLRITSTPLRPDAPAIWKQADTDARAELAALAAQVPSVLVEAHRAPPGASLALDGRPVRAGESTDVDPGVHVATLTQGDRTVEASATVRAGERGVRISLAWEGTPPPSGSTPGASSADTSSEGSIVPGVIGVAVGGGAIALGAVFGLVALGTDSDVVASCPGGSCGADVDVDAVRDDQSSAGTMADLSTVFLVAGGVLATAGVVLLVVRPGGSEGPSTTASVGPGGLRLAGGF